MEKLREYPFCGGKARQSYAGAKHIIICPNCVKLPADGGYIDSKDAITAWNTRPDGWISVEDKLPSYPETEISEYASDRGQPVIVFNGEYVIHALWWIREKAFRDDFEILESVTHWMPLPEPPKGCE